MTSPKTVLHMKTLLRTATLLVLTLMLAHVSNAQTKQESKMQAGTELTAELDLTPEQSKQVVELDNIYKAKKAGLKTTSPNADNYSSKLKELEVSYLKELKSILTPEQLEKWRSMQPVEGK